MSEKNSKNEVMSFKKSTKRWKHRKRKGMSDKSKEQATEKETKPATEQDILALKEHFDKVYGR